MDFSNDLTSCTAIQLQEKLCDGSLTSVDLVRTSLEQITTYSESLNVLISVCPEEMIMARAAQLDKEREAGRLRSRLHGIPIVVKDAILTDRALGMPTTVGSFVFASMQASKNAKVVDRLLDAGLIILGKSNMTEFAGLKSNNTPIGWSAYGGQAKSAYWSSNLSDPDQPAPGGSSSGSAVAIAAGFCPLALGTETAGSTVYPASLSGLYAIKLTPEMASTHGVFALSESYDGLGVMARDPDDLVLLSEVIMDPQARDRLPQAPIESGWADLSIGIVDIAWGVHSAELTKWSQPAVKAAYDRAITRMKDAGARTVFPLQAPEAGTLAYGEQTLTTVAYREFPSQIQKFISNFSDTNGVYNLKDVVAWNEKHADIALPDPFSTQTELEAALNNTLSDEERAKAKSELQRLAGQDGLNKVMLENGLDIILSSTSSSIVAFAACAGWPIGTVPLGNLEKNREPFGFFAVAREGQVDVLLKFMVAFHATFPGIEKPALLKV